MKILIYGGNFKEIKRIDEENKKRFSKRWWDFNGTEKYTCLRCRNEASIKDITSSLGSMVFCKKCVNEIADAMGKPYDYVVKNIIHKGGDEQ